MSRQTIWKEFHFTSHDEMHKLQSYQDSNVDAWKQFNIVWEEGAGIMQTNLPWYVLRAWFRYSDVPMPSDYHTGDHPSWAEHCTCGAGDKVPHWHLKTCEAF